MYDNKEIPSIHDWNSYILGTTSRSIFMEPRMATLGTLTSIVAKIPSRRSLSISSFYHWVANGINNEQIKLLQGELDIEPTGYLIWAWANDKTVQEYLSDSKFVPHPSQWSEGRNLIILDIFLPSPQLDLIKELQHIRRQLKKSGVKNIYYRSSENRTKQYIW
ncbi:toxin-activating lysine-acyltransferase [Vibrio cionasavignyae]|uniref:toxin-activating lysine-acyltransferase n=1 Tax=Vibrio cionasavignyae TaxID=2910252 RepID=UPI003D0B8216